jgi:multicomponent Na+:H+ antiporter subunit E
MKPALTASLLSTLIAFWLLLSGMYTPFLVAAGVGSAMAVTYLSIRMGLADEEAHPIHLARGAALSYWPWLAKEIIKSAWDVAKRIIDPRLPISPTLVEFSPSQRTVLGLVIHANSITLTPGTIAVEVEPGRFLVHALTAEGASGLANSEMDRRCTRLEGSSTSC